jgi:hypothetical protein
VPHLLSKKEILKTFKDFYTGVISGGGCLICVRDYGTLTRGNRETRFVPRRVHEVEGGRVILFDLWDFKDDIYQSTIYVVEEFEDEELKITAAKGGKYYCIETDQLEHLFLQAGF